jgi:hypothetical protein
MEGLLHLYPDVSELRRIAQVLSVSDKEIPAQSFGCHERAADLVSPHHRSSCARKSIVPGLDHRGSAQAAKFDVVEEPLISELVAVPHSLAKLLEKASHFEEIDPGIRGPRRSPSIERASCNPP